MKATHTFALAGITGYVFPGEMVRYGTITAHIDSLAGPIRVAALFKRKPIATAKAR